MISFPLTLASPAIAQPDPGIGAAAVDEIVVTGRALPEAVGTDAYAVVTIGGERLGAVASGRLEDALKDVAGLTQFRRSDARSANVTSQGATLRGIGGNASSRALVVLDGAPQNDPFGGWIAWPAYAPNRLAGVRVTRGGGAGALGPGALAGTIELQSIGPQDTGPLSGSFFYGARDSLDANALVAGEIGDVFAFVGGSYARGDGFAPIVEEDRGAVDGDAPYEQASISARALAPLGAHRELQLSFLAFTDQRNRGVVFTDNSNEGFDLSARLVSDGDWAWSALLYWQQRELQNSFAAVTADRSSARQVLEQFDVPSTGVGGRLEARPPVEGLFGDAFELRLGGDWRRTVGETNERFFFVDEAPTRQRLAGGESLTAGLFAEGGWTGEGLTITGGARVDYWRLSEGERREFVIADGALLNETFFPRRTGVLPTGRLAADYALSGALSLRAAGYIGWRLPTLNELYRPFRVGSIVTGANADLEPERSRGVEIGLTYAPADNVGLSITGFDNRLRDGVANVTVGAGPGFFPDIGFVPGGGFARQRRNIDVVRARGVELDASLSRGDWTVTGSYAFTGSRIENEADGGALDGLRPAQIPAHTASTTLSWRTVSTTLRYTSDRFEDDLNLLTLDDAFTVDVTAELPLGRGFSFVFRGENLADETVEAAVSAVGVIERARPRTLWVGLTFDGR